VPGPIRSRSKQGCHRLIRDGAQLVASPHEVLSALLGFENATLPIDSHLSTLPSNLTSDERSLLTKMGHEPRFLDELVVQIGWSVAKTAATLAELEVRGIIVSQPGQGFQRRQ